MKKILVLLALALSILTSYGQQPGGKYKTLQTTEHFIPNQDTLLAPIAIGELRVRKAVGDTSIWIAFSTSAPRKWLRLVNQNDLNATTVQFPLDNKGVGVNMLYTSLLNDTLLARTLVEGFGIFVDVLSDSSAKIRTDTTHTSTGLASWGGMVNYVATQINALSFLTNPMTTSGDLIGGGTSGTPTRIAAGTSTQLLHGGNTWSSASLTADVSGILAGTNGGMGVNNGSKTVTISGNISIGSSTHTVAFTTSANTSVVLPTTGTLSTLAGAEALTNKTFDFTANTVNKMPVVICIAIGDETTAITTGTAKVTIRMPYGVVLTAVRASLTTISSSGIPTVDINEAGVTILSTKLTIDASEKTSTTAATAAVISDASLADDAEITFDIDVAGTGATGLKVYLIGYKP